MDLSVIILKCNSIFQDQLQADFNHGCKQGTQRQICKYKSLEVFIRSRQSG